MKWGLAWRIVDTLLGIAIRADEINDRRKAKKRLELLGEAMQKDAAKAARSRARTVVLPRPEPSTNPPAAGAVRAPTAPSKASPRRQ